MGFFDKLFGSGEEKEIAYLRRVPAPRTQKEAYERRKEHREWDAEWDSEDDPQRIEKAINRHHKKAQKRGEA